MPFHQDHNSRENYNYNVHIYTDAKYDAHFHGNYELICGLEGITEFSVNGKEDTLQEGEMILISPYVIHSVKIKNATTWIGVFSEDFIPAFSEKNRYKRYSKFKCDDNIQKILKDNLFLEKRPPRYLHIAYLYMVCNECEKNASLISLQNDNVFIRRVIEYISGNLKENLTLSDIANDLNYEYHYFSSIFHKCFSMNFKNFINIFKFENACKMLIENQKDITEICNECGFGSIRNFNRVFKSLSGLTPTEYKKLSR